MNDRASKMVASIARTTLHLRDVPPSGYRLPSDGRKVRAICKERRALTLQLGSHADPDGQNIWVGRERLSLALGFSIRKVSYLLADLVALKFVSPEGWHGHTRRRSLDLEAIFQASQSVQDRVASGSVQNRIEVCRIGPRSVQNSSGTRPAFDLPTDDTLGVDVDSESRAKREGMLTVSSSDDVARVLRAFELSPVTTGKAQLSDRVTARELLAQFTPDQIEYGILLASSRRTTSSLNRPDLARNKVQTLAYFANAIEEAAEDKNCTASYADYLRHTLNRNRKSGIIEPADVKTGTWAK